MSINLFYLSGNTTGGWVTYTAHLIAGLSEIGIDVRLYKIGNNTERKTRDFGYGIKYRNLNLRDSLTKVGEDPSLIVALQKNSKDKAVQLLKEGSWITVHDPAEFKNLELDGVEDRYITIRKEVYKQLPKSTLIIHPYKRRYEPGTMSTGEIKATSICRIDFDKNTTILLDANRKLDDGNKIVIRGFENRLYTRFKICPNYPEWEQSKAHYDRNMDTAVELCHKALYTVDMSLIKGDGGGTQYSFMEAMDAGSICIVHRGWIKEGDEMIPAEEEGANCYAVSSGDELADLLSTPLSDEARRELILNGDELLAHHNHKLIGRKYAKTLGAL